MAASQRIRYRAEQDWTVTAETVKAGDASVLDFAQIKCAIAADREAKFGAGNHNAIIPGVVPKHESFDVLHIPFRSQKELVKRAATEARRRAIRKISGRSWQSAYFAERIQRGEEIPLWNSLSCDADGALKLERFRKKLVPDDRLRNVLLIAYLHGLRTRLFGSDRPSANAAEGACRT